MAPVSQSEKVEAMRKRVAQAVSLFEHREGSKQVDSKDIGALVSAYVSLQQLHANMCHANP